MKLSHRTTDIILSLIGGFLSAFATLSLLPYIRPMGYTGQLIAGKSEVNEGYPTTLNMMHATMDGTNAMTLGLSSYAWWIAVIFFSVIFAAIIFRLIRRAV